METPAKSLKCFQYPCVYKYLFCLGAARHLACVHSASTRTYTEFRRKPNLVFTLPWSRLHIRRESDLHINAEDVLRHSFVMPFHVF